MGWFSAPDRTTERYIDLITRRELDDDFRRAEQTRERLRREQEQALKAERERVEKGSK